LDCQNLQNIFIGNDFTGNFNLTILDIHEVHIGNHVMIGPNTLITTVGHPLSPSKRRGYMAQAAPVNIGNDVWIGGNVTILPGITIGNNVVVAAGAVVTRDVPDNTLVGGIPARKLKDLVEE
jgi:maltose O-acetyltransferase